MQTKTSCKPLLSVTIEKNEIVVFHQKVTKVENEKKEKKVLKINHAEKRLYCLNYHEYHDAIVSQQPK